MEQDMYGTWKKRWMAGILALVLILAAIPVQNVSAAPKALSMEDFYYYSSGHKMFFDDDNCNLAILAGKTQKTYRGIKVGNKLSEVKKKYGKAKKKLGAADSFNKYIEEYDFVYGFSYGGTFSKWKSFVEYTYKKNTKEDRRLRFYLDKNDKVAAIVYIRSYKKLKLTNKTVKNIDLSFQAPKGKKITVKTIGGKKVQMLPAGSKMIYNQSKVPEFGILGEIFMYDTKNRVCGQTIMPMNLNWSSFNGAKIETVLQDAGFQKINPSNGNWLKTDLKKLGKYNYFELLIYDTYMEGGFDRPLRYYFQIK